MRHRGTFGGALAHADPAGDLPAVALALDARVRPRRARAAGARCPRADFFVDYLTTALEEGELLVEVPRAEARGHWGMHYEKFNRVAQAWSIVAVAARGPPGERAHRRGAHRADQHGPDAAAGDRRRGRRWRGRTPRLRPIAAAAAHAAEGTARAATSTPRPTTGSTSRRCSPVGR